MGRLFGTDGVRGVAGELLSAELALALGKAATARTGMRRARVLIVRDTRESGQMLEFALAAGVSAAGGEALLGGVLPTPAAPLLVKRYGFDLAAVISASHNPFEDNGIKFFAADGFKLSDEVEREIEAGLGDVHPFLTPTRARAVASVGSSGATEVGQAGAIEAERGEAIEIERGGSIGAEGGGAIEIERGEAIGTEGGGAAEIERGGSIGAEGGGAIEIERGETIGAEGGGAAEIERGGSIGAEGGGAIEIGCVRELRGAHEDYLRELQTRFAELRLDGRDIAIDCANGATCRVAPEIFRRLGAKVTVLAAEPDGRNINDGCGSTHIERLGEAVRAGGHELGFAFDGDGDRVLAVDRDGVVVDGDELIALVAVHLRERGRLAGEGVVVTVMTNYGFHAAMRDAGIEVAVTAVGDRYVIERLRSSGFSLGGEQSGHIVDMGFNSTGDGIASALLTLEALGDRDLTERGAMAKLPQRLVNVRVRDRGSLESAESINEAVRAENEALSGRGRVLVRPSGTEPLVRVMVEAPTGAEADEVCSRLVALVERELA